MKTSVRPLTDSERARVEAKREERLAIRDKSLEGGRKEALIIPLIAAAVTFIAAWRHKLAAAFLGATLTFGFAVISFLGWAKRARFAGSSRTPWDAPQQLREVQITPRAFGVAVDAHGSGQVWVIWLLDDQQAVFADAELTGRLPEALAWTGLRWTEVLPGHAFLDVETSGEALTVIGRTTQLGDADAVTKGFVWSPPTDFDPETRAVRVHQLPKWLTQPSS